MQKLAAAYFWFTYETLAAVESGSKLRENITYATEKLKHTKLLTSMELQIFL